MGFRIYGWWAVQLIRSYRPFVIWRIRRKIRCGRRVEVVFLVTEISKWKGQSLYDAMAKSQWYHPVIAVFPTQRERELTQDVLMIQEKLSYFRSRSMDVVDIWNIKESDASKFLALDADVVFYQQPWELVSSVDPARVSLRCLTYYFPYYLINNLDLNLELGETLHGLLTGYIVLNDFVAKLYQQNIDKYQMNWTTEFLPLGHPILDRLELSKHSENLVIYAPHWTFEYGDHKPTLHYSTFLENGQMLLDFAKSHSDIKWVFKPHPLLRHDLVSSGAMSKEEVDRYYAEWETLGPACYDASYESLFVRSRVLITDCGSFLTEYATTGNPIIRPKAARFNVANNPVTERLYATYYETHNNDELLETLNKVVVGCEDPNRDVRLKELMATGLVGMNSSQNIIDYLNRLLLVE